MIGRLVSFWDGLFSVAMLVRQGVSSWSDYTTKTPELTIALPKGPIMFKAYGSFCRV